jgi:hypothetical protein
MIMAEVERVSISELELYGLSVRNINSLEDVFGLVYVDQLESMTADDFSGPPSPCRQNLFGRADAPAMRELRRALANFLEGRPVKTVKQCLEFSHHDGGGDG